MTRNAKSNYDGKCGTCIYFAFYVKNGDTREQGRCCHPNRVDYHQASQKACKEYEAESEDIGDYPDEIPNQFDNVTGSMNL